MLFCASVACVANRQFRGHNKSLCLDVVTRLYPGSLVRFYLDSLTALPSLLHLAFNPDSNNINSSSVTVARLGQAVKDIKIPSVRRERERGREGERCCNLMVYSRHR